MTFPPKSDYNTTRRSKQSIKTTDELSRKSDTLAAYGSKDLQAQENPHLSEQPFITQAYSQSKGTSGGADTKTNRSQWLTILHQTMNAQAITLKIGETIKHSQEKVSSVHCTQLTNGSQSHPNTKLKKYSKTHKQSQQSNEDTIKLIQNKTSVSCLTLHILNLNLIVTNPDALKDYTMA